MHPEDLDPTAVRRARVAADGVHERSAVLADTAATWAIQDSPPHTALDALRHPPSVVGLRLLPPGDPLLRARDRDILLPDEDQRRTLRRPTGAPGAVLLDGYVVAPWRGRARRGHLGVEVAPAGRVRRARRDALEAEAAALAALRGLEPGELREAT